MPRYDCKCLKCGKAFDGYATVAERDNIKCECGSAVERMIGGVENGYQPLTPYFSENMGRDPILIESRSHRQQLMKERKLDIMPYKKLDVNNNPRDRNGHKMTAHEIEKSRYAGFKPR